jgi:indole-3-glycerol phosphate synthase
MSGGMNILERIRAYKLADVAALKETEPLDALEAAARAASPVRGFTAALGRASLGGGYGLIAEIKRASPSKGLIRADFDPAALATAYAAGGAACLSVLTDGPSFQGEPGHLGLAREAVALPVLRKDFLFDPWQVTQSRALGADCILIVLAAVTDAEAQSLEDEAERWGMDVLVEVHTAEEVERATRLRSTLIGINNRDLTTFEVDLRTTRSLVRGVPENRVIVAESGLSTREDLAQLARFGVRCFLVGETLMRAENVEAATRELLRSPWTPEAG